jgi:dTDP-D-glucose 4,6-dehydratase
VQHRRPSIRNAKVHMGWEPQVTTRESVERTLDWFLRQHAKDHGLSLPSGAATPARATAGAARKP